MKALVLNGARDADEPTNTATGAVLNFLSDGGWEIENISMKDTKVGFCVGCFGCWVKTPGVCIVDDAGRNIAEEAVGSDLLVLVTPLTFGCYSSELKKALDRMIPIISPYFENRNGETHHQKRYENYPDLAVIAVADKKDEESESVFRRLVSRNGINFYSENVVSLVVSAEESHEEMTEHIRVAFGQVGSGV